MTQKRDIKEKKRGKEKYLYICILSKVIKGRGIMNSIC